MRRTASGASTARILTSKKPENRRVQQRQPRPPHDGAAAGPEHSAVRLGQEPAAGAASPCRRSSSPVSLALLAANVPLAALGGTNRTRRQPWIPVVAALKAAAEAFAASWYFYQMPAKEKAWCPYCIVGAVSNLGIMALPAQGAGRHARGRATRRGHPRAEVPGGDECARLHPDHHCGRHHRGVSPFAPEEPARRPGRILYASSIISTGYRGDFGGADTSVARYVSRFWPAGPERALLE